MASSKRLFNIRYELGASADQTGGLFIYDEAFPVLYINSGLSPDWEHHRTTWDEEVSHFVNDLDPKNRRDQRKDLIQRTGLDFAIDTGLAIPMAVLSRAIVSIAKKSKLTRREFLRFVAKGIPSAMVLSYIPAKMLSFPIYYKYFSPDEEIAHEQAKTIQTDKSSFDKMFQFQTRI